MEEHMDSELQCRELKDDEMRGWVVREDGKCDDWMYLNTNENKYSKLFSTPFRKFCKDVFLPQGFPESVHSDYIPYQMWDTVQAFASTILGTLTTHSIMRGVGVGDSAATPLAAAITWILKDGTGMIGRIVFAWWNGPELDAQCKKWRLFADILNDVAMGIELCVPYSSSYATAALCVSSAMKSLVGVAGGATRAAITQHQALSNNLADVSAKDGSQETCVNLIASLVGILILSYTDVSSFVEMYYVILVAVHIYANYSAVRSLCFETFNENRLALVVKNYLTESVILSPEKINERESVKPFQRPSKDLCGFDIVIGGSLDKFMKSVKIDRNKASITAKAVEAYRSRYPEYFFSIPHPELNESGIKPLALFIPDFETMTIYVALEKDVTPSGIIDVYFEAILRGIYWSIDMYRRPDIMRTAESSEGPLSLLYKKMQEWRRENDCRGVENIDNFIDGQRTKWSRLLDISEWKREVTLLPIGPYRSYWDPCMLIKGLKR